MKNLFKFGTREIVYGAIGAALYGVLSWVTNIFPLPAAGNITFRPAVVIPIFFGIAFGPWVGLISGFVGNMLGDFMSGWGFWWYWCLGNGIMGFLPGLFKNQIESFKAKASIIKGEIAVLVGTSVGMLVPSLLEVIFSGITLSVAIFGYWLPAFAGNLIIGLILLPLVMIAYDSVASRSGR